MLLNEEKSLFHPMLLIMDAKLAKHNLNALSDLLSTNYPLNIFLLNNEQISTPKPEVSWEDASHGFRQELSTFITSHRNVFYYQGTSDRPAPLSDAINHGLRCSFPTVWHLLTTEEYSITDLSKMQWARLSKYFPVLNYDPLKQNGGNRFNLNQKEHSKRELISFEVSIEIDGKISVEEWFLTYADYKALFREKLSELLPVPEQYHSDYLVTLSDYLQSDPNKLYGKIPFIWLVNGQNELTRVAVPHHWVVSCQERIDFWEYLKDVSGNTNHNQNAEQLEAEEVPVNKVREPDLETIKEEATQEAVNRILKELLADL